MINFTFYTLALYVCPFIFQTVTEIENNGTDIRDRALVNNLYLLTRDEFGVEVFGTVTTLCLFPLNVVIIFAVST